LPRSIISILRNPRALPPLEGIELLLNSPSVALEFGAPIAAVRHGLEAVICHAMEI
jgi:hypothetical protein